MSYFVVYTAYLLLLIGLAGREGHPGGALYLSILVFISMLSLILVFNPWRRDLFEPLNLSAALYGLSFGLGPLLLGPFGIYDVWYYGFDATEEFFTIGAAICLSGFLAMLIGYFVVPPRRWIPHDIRVETPHVPGINYRMLWGGIGIGLVGLLSYAVLVTQSGGIERFFTYSEGRADIFSGVYGGFYWGAYFIVSGVSVVGAALVKRRPFLTLLIGMAAGALFALLQGRADAIIPILVCVALINYGFKKVGFRTLVVSSIALILVASLLGAYRAAEKQTASEDLPSVVSEFADSAYEHFNHTIATDVERLDIVLVVYKYIEEGGDLKGGRTLFGWLQPISTEFFDASEESQTAGPFLFQLLNPHASDARAGAQPSLPGELLLNFGLAGVLIGLFVYGAVLKLTGRLVNKAPLDELGLALYPYIAVMLAMIAISGTHVIFRIIIVTAGSMAVVFVTRRKARRPPTAQAVRRSSLSTR